MRIAILHPFQFRYVRGIERFVWSLGKAFSQENINVDLLTWHWPNPVSWGDIPAQVRIKQMPYYRYFMGQLCIPYYITWLAQEKYDWVILFFAGYGEAKVLEVLRRFKHQRYCIVFHYPLGQVPHRYAEFERTGLVRHADCLVGVSEYVARDVEIYFGRDCAVISNGVDPSIFSPSPETRASVRQQLGIEANTPILISLTALEERKGVQWVIRAISYLLPEFPNLQYWVLGEGDYRRSLETEIQKLQLEQHIHLFGRSDNVIPYLAAADVGILLSYGEAFGIAVIEYMAMALPVVTSEHPPFDELIQPAWGYMVEKKNSEIVATKLRSLLSNPNRCQVMGQAGRQEVLHRYIWAKVADDYLHLLSSTMITRV